MPERNALRQPARDTDMNQPLKFLKIKLRFLSFQATSVRWLLTCSWAQLLFFNGIFQYKSGSISCAHIGVRMHFLSRVSRLFMKPAWMKKCSRYVKRVWIKSVFVWSLSTPKSTRHGPTRCRPLVIISRKLCLNIHLKELVEKRFCIQVEPIDIHYG